jgi:hypothetical protein
VEIAGSISCLICWLPNSLGAEEINGADMAFCQLAQAKLTVHFVFRQYYINDKIELSNFKVVN